MVASHEQTISSKYSINKIKSFMDLLNLLSALGVRPSFDRLRKSYFVFRVGDITAYCKCEDDTSYHVVKYRLGE